MDGPRGPHRGRHFSAHTVEIAVSAAWCMVALQRCWGQQNQTNSQTDDLFWTVVRDGMGRFAGVETPRTSLGIAPTHLGSLWPCPVWWGPGDARRVRQGLPVLGAWAAAWSVKNWPALQITSRQPSLRCNHGESRIASNSSTGNLHGIWSPRGHLWQPHGAVTVHAVGEILRHAERR